jgi:hypothetical protein
MTYNKDGTVNAIDIDALRAKAQEIVDGLKLIEKPAQVDTGLDKDKPELWTWWRGHGDEIGIVADHKEKRDEVWCFQYGKVFTLAWRDGDRPFWFGTDMKLIGRSSPGCDLEDKPLVGGVWNICNLNPGERIITGFHVADCGSECVDDNTGGSHFVWRFIRDSTFTFLRMSQLDPKSDSVKPLSETIQVGDVFKWNRLSSSPEIVVDWIGTEWVTTHCVHGGEPSRWRRADLSHATLVSRYADRPIEERLVVGKTTLSTTTGIVTHRNSVATGIKCDPGGWCVRLGCHWIPLSGCEIVEATNVE